MFFHLWTGILSRSSSISAHRPIASFSSALHRSIKSMSTQTYSEAWLAGPNSTQFYTRTYEPTPNPVKAAVVFIHGFAEHIGRYTHFHPLLAARGIAVFTFDQRGFGLTGQDTKGNKSKDSTYGKTCWKAQMGDIEWAVKHTQKLFDGVPVFLMGHSMVRVWLTSWRTVSLNTPLLFIGWCRGPWVRNTRR